MEYVIAINGSVVYTCDDAALARRAYVEYFHNAYAGDVVELLCVVESAEKQPVFDQE